MSRTIRKLLTVALAALTLTVVSDAFAETSYTDPQGDAGSGPDITQVVVSDAIGRVAFKVTCSMIPSSEAAIWIDVNKDGSNEFMLIVGVEADGKKYYGVYKWNGSKFEFQQGLGQAEAVSSSSGFEISVSQAALELTGSFAFELEADLYAADAVVASDGAPDGTLPWTYQLAAPAVPTKTAAPTAAKVTAVIAKPVTSLPKPTAGKPLTITFGVARSDNGGVLTTGTATATATIGGKSLPVRLVGHAGNAGKARVTLVLPKTAKGKALVVRLRVTAGGTTTSRKYTAVVS